MKAKCKYCGKENKQSEFDKLFSNEALTNLFCSDECKQKYIEDTTTLLDKKRQDPPEMQDIYREMMGNLTSDEFENVMQEQGREYFTAILNGKEIKCWLCAKEFIPDIEGKLYAMGYAWDGERHHNIKVYLD